MDFPAFLTINLWMFNDFDGFLWILMPESRLTTLTKPLLEPGEDRPGRVRGVRASPDRLRIRPWQ